MATIKLSCNYPVSKEKIWEYLTNDELLTSWCLPSKNFSLEKGREFKFQSTPSIFWDGIFINTIVTWRIVENNSSTELLLEHSGFRPVKDLFTKIALTGGWKICCKKKCTVN
jgi:hypothetical protein